MPQGMRGNPETDVGCPAQERVQGDLSLEPRERRPQTEMHPLPKRKMPVRFALEVEARPALQIGAHRDWPTRARRTQASHEGSLSQPK